VVVEAENMNEVVSRFAQQVEPKLSQLKGMQFGANRLTM
jgi:hypothetical protein